MGIADHLASCSVADRLLMLPPIYHTYAKESDGWCGTLNLEGTTLTMVVVILLKGSSAKDKARRFIQRTYGKLCFYYGRITARR